MYIDTSNDRLIINRAIELHRRSPYGHHDSHATSLGILDCLEANRSGQCKQSSVDDCQDSPSLLTTTDEADRSTLCSVFIVHESVKSDKEGLESARLEHSPMSPSRE